MPTISLPMPFLPHLPNRRPNRNILRTPIWGKPKLNILQTQSHHHSILHRISASRALTSTTISTSFTLFQGNCATHRSAKLHWVFFYSLHSPAAESVARTTLNRRLTSCIVKPQHKQHQICVTTSRPRLLFLCVY